ncbi:MAG TPA: hypothetical protein VIM42_02615 [Clostridium sp.]
MANLDQYEGNFTIFNNEIWDIAEEFDLSNGAVVLYMKIKSMTYGMKKSIFPSQLYLSRALRCSVRTVQRYLGELVKARCLNSLQRHITSNLYSLLPIKRVGDGGEVISLSTGTTQKAYKEEFPLILNPVCKNENIRDDDETLAIIKVLGDNRIDIDSPRGQEYMKIIKQECSSPSQLNFSLKIVNEKIKQGKIKVSEFGFVVSSIRQQKSGLVVLYPTKKTSISQVHKRPERCQNRRDYYDKFYG